ncbi:glycosyltransferase family A protein [Sphingomonas bacterium]|uniref:glycosyltransferase family 2 protein n=1 Tax=Sphingomonas bacterium TaxID=1895847 RepID=UPI0015765BE9|nr:glycosyltransferase family A protein [Sphingomonas bacterium]
MLFDFETRSADPFGNDSGASGWTRPAILDRRMPDWSVVVPFFNERVLLPLTLESLAAQRVRARFILVDNGSTDGSAGVATAACRRLGLDFVVVTEARPGKVAALTAGLRLVRTIYVATCDADTWYPADYLANAGRVLAEGHVVVGAYFVTQGASADAHEKAGRRIVKTAALLRGQCHTGGAGQAFRTDVLRRAGGFDAARWSYVLEDHEIVHQVLKHGTMGYATDLWCVPSVRDRDRPSIRWTLAERLLYAALAPVAGDWFFYRFLGRRLDGRRLSSQSIRERRFHGPERAGPERTVGAAAYSVCG